LTIYDMCKAVDRQMQIYDVCLIEKTKRPVAVVYDRQSRKPQRS
ncbi:MAG: hypothetical protein DMF10_03525, partial [Verrucomicrobia bacterium]